MRSRTSEERYSRSSSARSTCSRETPAAPSWVAQKFGLADEVGEGAHVGGETALVLDHARGVLDQARDGVAVEAEQATLLALGSNQRSEAEDVVAGALEIDLEIRLDAEQLTEVRVEADEVAVEGGVADDHDLHVQWDRLRPQRAGGDQSERFSQVLHRVLTGGERPLQPVVGGGVLEQVA